MTLTLRLQQACPQMTKSVTMLEARGYVLQWTFMIYCVIPFSTYIPTH